MSFKGIFKSPFSNEDIRELSEPLNNEPKEMGLVEAIQLVQDEIFKTDKIVSINKQKVISLAMAGDLVSIERLKSYIEQILETNNIKIQDSSISESKNLIFSRLYGLGVVQPFYEDKTVDEIRVNNMDHVFIVKKGISQRVSVNFESEEEIELVIKRMIMEDTGVSLDRSSPSIESVRLDGSRLTATCRPVTSTWTFVLRKHDSFEPTIKNYIEGETFDIKAWEMISILTRGRCKLLFSGNVGSGKTTLLKKTLGELNDKLRIMVIGKDLEMKLQETYPDKDIVEMEEQAHLGIYMKDLFYLALRESPDVLVIEEFRGSGEATEAIRSCTRGLPHAMATAHFNSAEESVEGTAMFMLEEGLNLPLELAKLRVARAFNIVIQLFGDAETGKKKLISITEIIVNEKNEINYNVLLEWNPVSDEFLGEGSWRLINNPSPKCMKEMLKTVTRDELKKVGWDVAC